MHGTEVGNILSLLHSELVESKKVASFIYIFVFIIKVGYIALYLCKDEMSTVYFL